MTNEENISLSHLPNSLRKWFKECVQLYNYNFISLPLLISLNFIINLAILAIPILILNIFDRAIPERDTALLLYILLALVVFILVEAGLKYLRFYIITFNSARYDNNKTKNLIKNIIMDPSYYNIGLFQHSLNEIGADKALYANSGIVTLTELPFLLMYIGFLLYINPILAFIPLVLIIIFTIFSLNSTQQVGDSIYFKHLSIIKKDNLLYHTLNNLRTIKRFGRINLFHNRFKVLMRRAVKQEFITNKEELNNINLNNLFAQINIILIIAVGSYLITINQIGIGGLVASVYIASKSFGPTIGMFKVIKRLHETKLIEDLSISPSIHQKEMGTKVIETIYSMIIPLKQNKKEVMVPFMKGDTISLENADENMINYILSSKINQLRNKILINDDYLINIDETSIYKKITILNGQVNIWDGTIKENLTSFGLIPESNLNYYINTLGLNEILSALPLGLETYITQEDTSLISNEAKALIYMTRKLALDPEVIFLNDFEANIDKRDYAKVYNHIANIRDNKIIFINSKDHNYINLCNRDLFNNRIGEYSSYLT
ncbi:ABC transporter transmembrane domain-containing protein [Halobacteriovorax sp.]|uniref:ABC transporter transmembrane domain-containing protein n=1 Tax=Halobacteriovorax sp. TaxID=2020862 RepID=UPI003AF2B65B